MSVKTWNLAEYAKKAREAVAEGIVLLRNEKQVLPLKEKEKITVFGRSQFNYYKSGTGSGGAVNVDYVVGIYEALEKSGRYELNQTVRGIYEEWIKDHPFDAGQGWASEPWVQEEMPVTDTMVKDAAAESSTAIVLIGRTAGEDQDNKIEPGSLLLTSEEREMLSEVCKQFQRTVVLLNTGNIIDMSWVDEFQPAAVAYVWQGGQEGGNGVLDVLSGDVCPSGRLSDTIAYRMEDYPSAPNYGDDNENIQQEDIYVGYRYFETFAPDKVRYPFGYGLSYTTFQMGMEKLSVSDGEVTLQVKVTNTGAVAGKEVVQVYCGMPQGLLGKPKKTLCAFGKTKVLAPGETESLSFTVPKYNLASYDDSGVTGQKSCYVLEAGTYRFLIGANVRDTREVGLFVQQETVVLDTCNEALAPVTKFSRMKPVRQSVTERESLALDPEGLEEDIPYQLSYEEVPVQSVSAKEKRIKALPKEIPFTGDQGWKLVDVAEGKVSMEEFLAQLTDEDLCCMIRGEGMSSPKVTPGIAGAFGGVTERLLNFGIPIGGCADGPSGIRMDCGIHAFSLPNGTCLACTFNEQLSEELYEWEGMELRKNNVDTLLGPGMNIHRSPLNGRNFEYFSEDPLLTGKMAAAQLRGMHRYQVTGTIKHFACNTQEHHRNRVNSVVSERAVREIYLKGFEIAVKEGEARSVMSTYGPINGIWTASNYDLLTEILRNEWGYKGIVMTDWWALGNDDAGEEPSTRNVASQVRAQNDLNMVNTSAEDNSNEDNLMEALKAGTLTRGELQRSAGNICRFLMGTPAFDHMQGKESPLDLELKKCCSEEDLALQNMPFIDVTEETTQLPVSEISTEKGKTTTMGISLKYRGKYRLDLTLRGTSGGALAQLPVTIYKDREVMKTVTLNGDQMEWMKEDISLGLCFGNQFYLRFFFAQSGIEIREAALIMEENCEEQIKQYIASKGLEDEKDE